VHNLSRLTPWIGRHSPSMRNRDTQLNSRERAMRKTQRCLCLEKISEMIEKDYRIVFILLLLLISTNIGYARECVPFQQSKGNELFNEFQSSNAHAPISSLFITRSGHTVCYDGRTKIARWVHERLSKVSIEGDASKKACEFMEEFNFPDTLRSTLKDYYASGFDRGHLACAANHKNCQGEMCETFYLSNICPQILISIAGIGLSSKSM
jgi:hypothetical protein